MAGRKKKCPRCGAAVLVPAQPRVQVDGGVVAPEPQIQIDCGHVYILVHPCMRGLVKIGYTTGPPEDRAKQLSQGTGVPPGEYLVAWHDEVNRPERVERLVHDRLKLSRLDSSREHFSLPLKDAIKIVQEVIREIQESEQLEAEKARGKAREEAKRLEAEARKEAKRLEAERAQAEANTEREFQRDQRRRETRDAERWFERQRRKRM